tara:strand:- start:11322 stop:11492 length:171 start_codon:yes stop_codon:yes gene_type:complete
MDIDEEKIKLIITERRIDRVKELIANFPPDTDKKAIKYWQEVLGKLELITYEGTKQ